MIGPGISQNDYYWRKAQLASIHDGDTINVILDLGFNLRIEHPLRIFGVNAPELVTAEGKLALDWGRQWIITHTHTTEKWGFMVQYISWDKYAPRFDGILLCNLGHCYNDDILASGNAVPLKGLHGEET